MKKACASQPILYKPYTLKNKIKSELVELLVAVDFEHNISCCKLVSYINKYVIHTNRFMLGFLNGSHSR